MTDDTREAGAGKLPSTPGRSTHFKFEHKLFSVEGSYFAHSRDTKETVFHVPLGDIKGVLALEVLRTEFGIEPDSLDGQLLGIIERCLRFVQEIRPNESHPREIIHGTAPWAAEHLSPKTTPNRLTRN